MHLEWRPQAPGPGPTILTSVLAEEADELRKLADGRTVLEIGSAYGYSSCVMALAGAEHITAIDPHGGETWLGDTYSAMQANLGIYNVADKVTIIRDYSQNAMPELTAEERKFGLVFVDGDHTGQAAEHDVAAASALCLPGGTIAVHDYLEHCCCPEVLHAANRALNGGPDRIVGTMAIYERA